MRFAPLNARDLNSASGSIGEDECASTSTKMTRQAAPATKLPNTSGFRQPNLADSRNAVTTPPNPTVANSAPSQSICATLEPRLSGTRQNEIATTAHAMGTLRKNAQRQEPCSMSHPPRTGPRAVVIAVNPDHVPMAWPRDFSSNDAPMIERLPGTSKAAPIPWMLRAMTSALMLGARPQAAEAAAKIATPSRNTRRRPNRSPSAPPARMSEDSKRP